ncbi:hypothetical protein ACHAXR_005875 [Thalassiosira sp. AJA248-18]
MTTLSSHSDLSNSFARTEGRCADLSNGTSQECVDNAGTGDLDCNGSDDLVFEDEEIASVEADGNSRMKVSDDGGPAEKQLLAAALVTSIVELAGTSCGASMKNTENLSGTKGVSVNARRSKLRERQSSQVTETNGVASEASLSLPNSTSSYTHVTPPTSASSSFSSVETMPETLTVIPNKNHSQTSGRTIYNRASKSAASEKVASVLASHSKNKIKAEKVLTAGVKKRKLNLSCADNAQLLNVVSLLKQGPSTSVPKSAKPLLCNSAPAPECAPKPQPSHKYEVTVSTAVAIEHCSSVDRDFPSDWKFSKTFTAQGKSTQKSSRSHILNKQGSKLTNLLVPNPLAGMKETTFNMLPSLFPNPGSKSKGVTKKTNTLMSAAPDALVPGSNPPSRNGSTMHLGGQLANIAESMSSQHYQTDGLAASCVSEVVPRERGRIFSIDLDPAVLDFVENVVDPLAVDDTVTSANHALVGSDVPSDSKNPCVTFKGGRAPICRDRGFSFEFFSFGINEDEPLPPVPAPICSSHIPQGNRVRGDSIIFDPNSFREGGIHETSALLHIKQENERQNSDGIQNGPFSQVSKEHDLKAGSSTTPTILYSPFASKGLTPAVVKTARKATLCPADRTLSSHPKLCLKAEMPSVPCPSEVSAAVTPRSIPQAFSDDTIHMPHGSDAAAAAAAGMPQTSPSNDGFSLSHTACPMDLLNKGGRIGIYLPEERKARIAKFQSKRKRRTWRKRIKYDCRKKLADSRPRVKGRFVKRSDLDGEVAL